MKKGFWFAVLAYLAPTFVLGYVWHLVTFKEAYDRLDVYRPDIIIPFGLATMVIQGVIFAWAYPRLPMRRMANTSGICRASDSPRQKASGHSRD